MCFIVSENFFPYAVCLDDWLNIVFHILLVVECIVLDMSLLIIHNFPLGVTIDAVSYHLRDCGNILRLNKISPDSFEILFADIGSAEKAVRKCDQRVFQHTGFVLLAYRRQVR